MTPYEVGERDGIEAARTGLVNNQRIAAKWAEARLSSLTDVQPTSPFAQGFKDGYRNTLEQYVASVS